MRCREILQKFHLAVEVDDKSLVLIFAQHLGQKALTGVAFFAEHPSLAHAGIHQKAEREWEIGFAGEIFQGLRAAVLGHSEIILGQAVYNRSVFVPHRGQHVDHFHLD